MGVAEMIGLLQRVSDASVTVDGARIAAIGRGLLVLVGVEREDGPPQALRLAERLLAYRVFPDAAGKMNLSVVDIGGDVLLVPQFTLVADTTSGNRPSFSRGADPAAGKRWFELLAVECRGLHDHVAVGRFGAAMQVALTNDGPVTFWLKS
jgi:D-tyrosyl-tRNA(Tyr) deacylase